NKEARIKWPIVGIDIGGLPNGSTASPNRDAGARIPGDTVGASNSERSNDRDQALLSSICREVVPPLKLNYVAQIVTSPFSHGPAPTARARSAPAGPTPRTAQATPSSGGRSSPPGARRRPPPPGCRRTGPG